MAYRVVQQEFWNDEKTIDLYSCEDKYFFLYLLTNPQATQLGIYKLPLKLASFQLGYSKEQVVVLIDRFSDSLNQIKYNYETQEIAIGNYLYHSIIKGGKPVIDCIERDLSKVSDKSLVSFVVRKLEKKPSRNQTIDDIVKLLKKTIKNDNDNDNDNEVSYHDTLDDTLDDTLKILKRRSNVTDNVEITIDNATELELELEKEREEEGKKEKKKSEPKKFTPPTLEQVQEYCKLRKNNVDAKRFFDYFEAGDWADSQGKKVKNWKQKIISWEQGSNKKEVSETDEYRSL